MSLERLVIDNIKRIRKEKGITQEKLAEACKTTTSYIGLMEIYRNVPKLATIERIAEAMGVDPLKLFEREKLSPPEEKAEMIKKKTEILALIDKQIEKILVYGV